MSRLAMHRAVATLGVAVFLGAGCTAAPPVATAPAVTPTVAPPSVTATPGVTATATAEPVPGARRIPTAGPIEVGRYYIEKGPWTPITFSFDIWRGWASQNLGQTISKHADVEGREVGFSVSIVDKLFALPCSADDELIEVGRSADDLASALIALPGVELVDTRDITLDGMNGVRLEITSEAGIEEADCDPPIGLQIWLDRNGNKYFVLGPAARSILYLLDTPNGRFVLVSGGNRLADPADMGQLEATIASIRFEP